MKTRKRAGIILLAAAAVLAAVYLAGRFGWRLAGFRACQRAGIDSVEVRDGAFTFDAAVEKLYLTVSADNRITAAAEP